MTFTEPVIIALITMMGGVIVESIRSGITQGRAMKELKDTVSTLKTQVDDILKKLRDYGF